MPQKINKQMTLSTLNGETIDITFSVSWRRYLFSPTRLRGDIEIDGKVYTAIHLMYK